MRLTEISYKQHQDLPTVSTGAIVRLKADADKSAVSNNTVSANHTMRSANAKEIKRRRPNGERVLRFARGKTRVVVEIEIVGELAKIIDECLAASVVRSTFVHRKDGERYTTDGLTSMFLRHCVAAKVTDFGLRDLRAKGATDEYRAGRPIRELQHLLGHKSVRTTEIYLKELIPETVRPNERPMIAAQNRPKSVGAIAGRQCKVSRRR